MCCSKLNNHFNIEENFFGRVNELPKEKKPLDVAIEFLDSEIELNRAYINKLNK